MDKETLRQLVANHAKLKVDVAELSDSSSLFEAGLTSLNTVNLMLAIEDHFDLEFDEEALTRDTFKSVESLMKVVQVLKSAA